MTGACVFDTGILGARSGLACDRDAHTTQSDTVSALGKGTVGTSCVYRADV